MRNKKRTLGICAALSGVIPATLLVLFALSHDVVAGFKGGIAVTSRFHVGVFDGGLWFHSDSLPYRGSVIAMSGSSSKAIRKKGFDLPGVYYRHFRFPLEPEPLWTLRLSLDYPLVVSAIFPLLWLNQVLRARRKRAEGDGGIARACHDGSAKPGPPPHERYA
ncbi:MAG TPA: hypothetical protein VL793_07350 [Patescibacteria group bacterium]|nr:hypothetical protein [Patescibacteria group bacterium]